MKDLTEPIKVDPTICNGKPCIAGTRSPVHCILDLLAVEESPDGILRVYPKRLPEDIQACLHDADGLAEEEARNHAMKILADENFYEALLEYLEKLVTM